MPTIKKCVLIIAVAVVGTLAWNISTRFQPSGISSSFTEFLRDVEAGRVAAISIDGNEVIGVNTRTGQFRTYAPRGFVGFINRLIEQNVDVSVVPEGFWSGRYSPWIAMLILIQLAGLVRRTARISSTA